jgi:predicted negative regulator of RcsB-dependent stress response
VDRLTRKELKKDVFAQEVGHTVEYVAEHRRQFIRYGLAALAVVVLLAGYFYYSKRQHAVRQRELAAATRIQDAGVGPSTGRESILTFPTVEEKNKAAVKAFTELAARHSGTEEGAIAQYYLGTVAADEGRLDEAVKWLKSAAESGSDEYASLANLSLAQVYHLQGKTAEAEKLLRALMAKPTMFVSKEQAIIMLARVLSATKPDEARKLLEPLRTHPGAVSRVALTVLGELPKQ